MKIRVNLGKDSYDIVLERGCLARAADYLDLNRKVLIVTDDGVPARYAACVEAACKEPVVCTIPGGEDHKTLETYKKLLSLMLAQGFGRKDCVVAVGGGICGDLAGFTAASYMRGVDFYNIPTTLLSQVDSSIGGKTAVNLDGIKNVVGAFYQPRKVLIDPEVLNTLPRRQIAAGLAEALKMAATFDPALFELFEQAPRLPDSLVPGQEEVRDKPDDKNMTDGNVRSNQITRSGENVQSGANSWSDGNMIDRIIESSLRIKGRVVEEDEKEQGLRRVLNFGHTIGHGIESRCLDGSLYHGECVALGMLPMSGPAVRGRLIPIYEKLGLPVTCSMEPEAVYQAIAHDKKAEGGMIRIICCDRIGSYEIKKVNLSELKDKVIDTVSGSYSSVSSL